MSDETSDLPELMRAMVPEGATYIDNMTEPDSEQERETRHNRWLREVDVLIGVHFAGWRVIKRQTAFTSGILCPPDMTDEQISEYQGPWTVISGSIMGEDSLATPHRHVDLQLPFYSQNPSRILKIVDDFLEAESSGSISMTIYRRALSEMPVGTKKWYVRASTRNTAPWSAEAPSFALALCKLILATKDLWPEFPG